MSAVVAFDMDGTLIDSAADIGAAVNRMRVSFGLKELPRESVVRMVGNGARVLVARALADTPGADLDEAFRRYRHEYDTHLVVETRLYPGVPDALDALKSAGFRLAVFTNKPYGSTLFILKELGIDAFFPVVVGADSGFPLKPAPDALHHILKETGADAAGSWMVGDNWTDIDSGHAAGFRTAYCTYGYGAPDAFPPDAVCASMDAVKSSIMDANKGK
ncbi:MAG: HAD-IA family hydrolase [Lentisphaeria bacterium]|nr:HAD-IA family hydrolase [Lentisphaeria bacterium]